MAHLKKKVYLFKAAPEDDMSQSLLLMSKTKEEVPRSRSPHNQSEQAQQHQERSNDGIVTTSTADNGGDKSMVGSSDRFITLLNEEGITNELFPVLVFQYSNIDNLWRHIKDSGKYAGIIFTSQRCVQSVKEAVKTFDFENEWHDSLRKKWASKYLFSVGPSTSLKVQNLFFPASPDSLKIIQGLESHAHSLSEKIIEVNSRESFNQALLYPCGAQRRDVLLTKLEEANIQISQCISYDTVKNPCLDSLLQKLQAEIKEYQAFLCFFSPSGVKFVFPHLKQAEICSEQTNLVAIGPTTKSALEDVLSQYKIQKPIYVCQNPTPEALLEIVKKS